MSIILQNLNSIAVLGGVVALVWFNFKNKTADKTGEVLRNYGLLEKQLKDQKDDLQRQLNTQQTLHAAQIAQLHKAIGEKDAIIKMKEELIVEMKTTLANRNPDLEGLLKDIRAFMEVLHDAALANNLIARATSAEVHKQTDIMAGAKVETANAL